MDYHHPEIAELYDLANPPGEDAAFYLSIAGSRPCTILDLGCGTGTLACALAERGHQVTGVDPAAGMLNVARRKAFADQVKWVESSAQSYKSNQHFDLIVMTGHAFQVLLTDADTLAVLKTMRDHLNKLGKAVFETRNPRIDWAGEWAARPPRTLPGTKISENLKITSHDDEYISFQTSYRLPQEALTTSSTLRFRSREQIEALIARSGLAVLQVFGDWNAGPFDSGCSREIIFEAGMIL